MRALQGFDETKALLILDALRYSLLSERIAYTRLRRTLRVIERRVPAGPREAVGLSALASAWQIVDTVHRARGLFGQVRGLSHRLPEYQLFVRVTEPVEALRNFFQHMNSSIGKLTSKSYPIMGSLCWVSADPAMSYSLSVGHWTKDVHSHSMVVDTWNHCFVASLQLNAATYSVELAEIHNAARSASVFLERWLRQSGSLSKRHTSPSLLGFRIGLPPDA